MNIVLTGFMGTGKTTVGKKLARRLGWKFVDVDELIERSAKMSIARIFAERGEPVFRRLERLHILRVIHGRHQVIATGGGAVLDPKNRSRLRASGPVICLNAKPATILKRVNAKSRTRPLLAGSKNPLARVKALLAQRVKAYGQADLTIDTSQLSVNDVVERLWQKLGPCVCKSWQYLLERAPELAQRYGGKYIVVVNDRIVGEGPTQLEAYQSASQHLREQPDAGIYYIPLREESLTALACA